MASEVSLLSSSCSSRASVEDRGKEAGTDHTKSLESKVHLFACAHMLCETPILHGLGIETWLAWGKEKVCPICYSEEIPLSEEEQGLLGRHVIYTVVVCQALGRFGPRDNWSSRIVYPKFRVIEGALREIKNVYQESDFPEESLYTNSREVRPILLSYVNEKETCSICFESLEGKVQAYVFNHVENCIRKWLDKEPNKKKHELSYAWLVEFPVSLKPSEKELEYMDGWRAPAFGVFTFGLERITEIEGIVSRFSNLLFQSRARFVLDWRLKVDHF